MPQRGSSRRALELLAILREEPGRVWSRRELARRLGVESRVVSYLLTALSTYVLTWEDDGHVGVVRDFTEERETSFA